MPQLSVIVPTFNERDNVVALFRRLEKPRCGIPFEAIFVDDNSPDGTWEVVRHCSREDDPRVRCIRRIGRRGLSGACIEGILASSAPCAAVIDADLQHDETQLPKMLALLQGGESDLVVGSRYIEGGSAESFDQQRAGASALATEVAKRVLRVEIADPMSGFFMIRRDRFEALAPHLSTQGFKILLDVVATAHGDLRVKEIPYHVRLAAAWREQARFHGGAGLPRSRAGEADQRCGVAAVSAVRDGRLARPRRAFRRALFVALEMLRMAVSRRRRPAARFAR